MAPVNELDHILRFLESRGIFMRQIADDLNLDYDYIKSQKTLKDRKKQSKKLVKKIKTRYAEHLTKMEPYIVQYDPQAPPQLMNDNSEGTSNDKSGPGLGDKGQERKELDVEAKEIMHLLYKKAIKQERKQSAQNRYIAKRDSNGDKQLEIEILKHLGEDLDDEETNEESGK